MKKLKSEPSSPAPRSPSIVAYTGPKRVPLRGCCCCLDLRLGAIVIFSMQIIGGLLAFADAGNKSGSRIADVLLGFADTICALSGLIGICRIKLKILKLATGWMFWRLGIMTILMVFMVTTSLAKDNTYSYCIARDHKRPIWDWNGSDNCESKCDPAYAASRRYDSISCDQCCSDVSRSFVIKFIIGTLFGILAGLYFAVCVYSAYAQMENELAESEAKVVKTPLGLMTRKPSMRLVIPPEEELEESEKEEETSDIEKQETSSDIEKPETPSAEDAVKLGFAATEEARDSLAENEESALVDEYTIENESVITEYAITESSIILTGLDPRESITFQTMDSIGEGIGSITMETMDSIEPPSPYPPITTCPECESLNLAPEHNDGAEEVWIQCYRCAHTFQYKQNNQDIGSNIENT